MGNELFDKKDEPSPNDGHNIDNLFKDQSKENKIRLIYKINSPGEKIRLVGSKFYENNKNSCKMINFFAVKDLLEFYKAKNNESSINITLALKRNIKDLSYMFSECTSLISITNLYDLNINNVTNLSYMFYGCSLLTSISDISNWRTNNVTDMSHMFHGCSNLSSLPPISKWETRNVIDMSYMFYGCSSLTYIDDISIWNIDNVNNLRKMFNNCPSLFVPGKALKLFFQKDKLLEKERKIKEEKKQIEVEKKRIEEEKKRIEKEKKRFNEEEKKRLDEEEKRKKEDKKRKEEEKKIIEEEKKKLDEEKKKRIYSNLNFQNKKEINSKNQQHLNFEISSLDNYFLYKNDLNANFNIIYLIDTTSSMKKYETFVYLLSNINNYLAKKFINMKIGYVLYKDFEKNEEYDPSGHIKIFLPSKVNINIPKDLEFSGGNDFSEDWGNSINKICELAQKDEENIVIHICDSNAHGTKFSEYDTYNDEEIILIKALQQCKTKNIKFIGLLIDDFARKSFLECKKLYNEIDGFYDVIDLTEEIDNELFIRSIIEKIINILNVNNIIFQKDWYNNYFLDIDESNFEFKGYSVEMKPLYDINDEYKLKKFTFLPNIVIKDFNSYYYSNLDKMHGIVQGYIGDCYLISSIISMTNIPLIFKYIFPNSLNIDERSKNIDMFIYKNGIKRLISFSNTYAKYKSKLLFAKPYNNELYGIALEKGFSI